MSVADRVLEGLGPAFRAAAGPLLPDMVTALVSEDEPADQLIQPADPDAPSWIRWWPAAFDLDGTPDPVWLGQLIGTAVPGGLTLEEQRAYIADRPAWRRGTRAALLAAVQSTLTGLKRVTIDERDGSAWQLTVSVYEAETPDPDAALAAALSQKPVGIVLDFQVLEGATYAHMTAEHGPTYADEAAEFPTYADAISHLPEP